MNARLKSWADSLLFPGRIDRTGGVVPPGQRTRIYQYLFERGICVPWIYSAERCHDFWWVGANDNNPNNPSEYAHGPITIMKYVRDYIAPYVPKDAAILEVGCNSGSKLNQLYQFGYQNLGGLDLNPAAFEVFAKCFPEVYSKCQCYVGLAGTALSPLPDSSFDLVYTISTLELVHPSQNKSFVEMARVSRRYILTLEIEWAAGRYFFPRNYRRIFERLGFTQVASALITRELCPEPELEGYWGHVLRLFRRN